MKSLTITLFPLHLTAALVHIRGPIQTSHTYSGTCFYPDNSSHLSYASDESYTFFWLKSNSKNNKHWWWLEKGTREGVTSDRSWRYVMSGRSYGVYIGNAVLQRLFQIYSLTSPLILIFAFEVGKEAKSVDDATNEDGYNIPLSHSLWTLSAALHFVWQFISLFMILFYTVSFNSWMRKATDDQDLGNAMTTEFSLPWHLLWTCVMTEGVYVVVAHYTKVMGMCQLIGPLITPISGIFTDWRVKVANRCKLHVL